MLVAIANDFEWSFKGGYNNCTLSAGGDGAIKLDAARLSCQGRYLPQVLHSSPSSFSLHLSYGLLYVWVSIWLASLTACIITKGFHSPCPACPCNTPVCPSLSLLLILLYSHTLFFFPSSIDRSLYPFWLIAFSDCPPPSLSLCFPCWKLRVKALGSGWMGAI